MYRTKIAVLFAMQIASWVPVAIAQVGTPKPSAPAPNDEVATEFKGVFRKVSDANRPGAHLRILKFSYYEGPPSGGFYFPGKLLGTVNYVPIVLDDMTEVKVPIEAIKSIETIPTNNGSPTVRARVKVVKLDGSSQVGVLNNPGYGDLRLLLYTTDRRHEIQPLTSMEKCVVERVD